MGYPFMNSPEPTGPPEWTPGAGVERLRREMPHLIPAEVSEKDRLRAAEIIAAGNARETEPERHVA